MWRLPFILAAFGLFTVAVFRVDAAVGLWPLAVLMLLALVSGLRAPDQAARSAVLLLALAALTAALRLHSTVWPCRAACAGAPTYTMLAGLPVELLGALACAGVAVALLVVRRAPRAPGWAGAGLWLLAGAALSFAVLAGRLDLACGHCRAVQGLVLAAAAVALRWAPPSAWALVGLLGVHVAFHPDVRRGEPAQPAAHASGEDAGVAAFLGARPATVAVLAAEDGAADAALEAQRLIGAAGAPLLLDEVVDLRCGHCATLHGQVLAELRAELAAARVALRVRQAQYRQDPLSTQLARWQLSAAALGATRHAELVERLFGLRSGDVDGARREADPVLDLPALDRLAVERAALLERALDRDRAALIRLRFRNPVPLYVLHDGPRELGRWQGDVAPADIVAAVRAATP